MTTPALDPVDVALRQLSAAGLLVERLVIGPPMAGKKVNRVDVEGQKRGKRNGWYVCDWFRLDNGQQVIVGSYGVWVARDPGITHLEFEYDKAVSDAERERLRAEQARLRELHQADLDDQRAEAAAKAAAIWPKLPDYGHVPYLQRKQVRMFGCRIGRNGALVVPVRRPFSSALLGLQFIQPDGDKRFLTGTPKQGAAHLIADGDLPQDYAGNIGLAEGYATAATCFDASGWPVFACFDCGNLMLIARIVHAHFPKARLVVFADHDQWTMSAAARKGFPADFDFKGLSGDDPQWLEWRTKGWLENAGLEAAFEILDDFGAAIALPPIPHDDPARRTDWNDLHCSAGLDAARAAIFAPGALTTCRPTVVDDVGPAPAPDPEWPPVPDDAPPAEEPAAVPIGELTQADLIARYELVHGQTDVWDTQLNMRMAFGAFAALVGDALAKAWKADTTKRVRIIPAAKKPPAEPASDLDDVPGEVDTSWKKQLVFGENGLKGTIWNVMHVLRNDPRWNGVLGYDAFAKRIVKLKPAPFGGAAGLLADTDETEAGAWFGRKDTYRAEVKTSAVREAITVVALGNSFHPVRDYLRSVTWDGVPRIDMFFSDYCGAAQTLMHAKFASNFFIQAVARIFRPGCKADLMLVLEGTQGSRKSTLVETLAGGFYADIGTGPSDKDFYQIIQGCWLVEISELASFARAESSHIKRAISVAVDRFRKSYGHNVEEFKRECVFFGTVNNSDWQRDETGGRRFMPVWVQDVDIEAVRGVRDQLWAEAVHRFNAGETWYELPPEAREAQDSRYVEDVWTTRIVRWLDGRAHSSRYRTGIPAKVMTTNVSELLSRVIELPIGKQGKSEQTRVGTIMTRLGWVRREHKLHGVSVRSYNRPAEQAVPSADFPDDEPLETEASE